MIGKEETRKILSLPLYHFLYYNVETEESSVYVLRLGASQRVEEEKAKQPAIQEGKIVEEAKAVKPEIAKPGESGREQKQEQVAVIQSKNKAT